ncbi:MAG TPA: hypothetical protein VGI43_04535 [Mucilaginibacter sp.]|jgi:hypothetical protein
MKYLFLCLFSFIAIKSFGQNTDSVSKIIFRYVKGGSSWGQPGVYSKYEIIEISTFTDKYYKITKHLLIKQTAGNDGKTFGNDTTELEVKRYKKIQKKGIEKLILQLNTTRDNFNKDYVIQYLKRPGEPDILRVARRTDSEWMFDKDSVDADDRKTNIGRIRNFYKLESFLNSKKPNLEYGELVIMDSWNRLSIDFIKNGLDTVKYYSQLYNLFGQPFYKRNKNPRTASTGIVNLEINNSIRGILPKSSFLKENIDLNNVKDEYIKWYLDKCIKVIF